MNAAIEETVAFFDVQIRQLQEVRERLVGAEDDDAKVLNTVIDFTVARRDQLVKLLKTDSQTH